MRLDYFRPTEKSPTLLVAGLLTLMLLALVVVPSLAFASGVTEEDPLPRYLISPEDIAKTVSDELQQLGYGELIQASLHTDDPNTMFGADEPIKVALSQLQANRKTKKWTANVLFKSGEAILTALPMRGRFDEMIELPVLGKSLMTGDIITSKHLITKLFPTHYRRADVVVSASELIGKSVRRSISVERPIRSHEISTPIAVKKHELVNLSYKNDGLSISTTGQVMEDAAIGDIVAVKNINSEKTVRAVIQEDKTASVVPMVQTTTAMVGGVHDYR